MPDLTLTAELGRPIGSRSSGRLRVAGKIPGVVYGHGNDPVPVAVDARALRAVLNTEAGMNALITLEMDGSTQLAMAKDVQRHPVRNTVTHIDFLAISRDEVITTDVPVTLVGEATELMRADGVVDHQLFNLTVNAKPGSIPNVIEIDISGLKLGDTIRVSDVALPDGVTTDADPEAAIVVGQGAQVTEADLVTEADAEAAAVAAAEDAGAEGAGEGGGDAAAAGGGEGGEAGGE
ncbi:MAG TPA: 50S ribosomal protein L25 [Acidimicrobiales bacterium]|nr:50S ribosomal protein L25 [Acidimicrobiales bacterium]